MAVEAFKIVGFSNLGHGYACTKCGALVLSEDRLLHRNSHKGWKASIL